jgi:hypothetical protein
MEILKYVEHTLRSYDLNVLTAYDHLFFWKVLLVVEAHMRIYNFH